MFKTMKNKGLYTLCRNALRSLLLPVLLTSTMQAQAHTGLWEVYLKQIDQAEHAVPRNGPVATAKHGKATRAFDEEAYAAEVEAFVKQIALVKCVTPEVCLKQLATEEGGKIGADKQAYPGNDDAIDRVWHTYEVYDFGFPRDSKIIEAAFKGVPPLTPPNLPRYEIKVFDPPTKQEISLVAYYLDQGSNKTIIMAGGFRGRGWELGTPEVDILKSLGFNMLMPTLRGGGESGGSFTTLGYYEKDDISAWVNDELSRHPDQEILLYGGSMGAATVLSALNNNLPANVKAVIEVSGFSSIDGQINHFIPANWRGRDLVAQSLDKRYLVPRLSLNVHDHLPINGVKASPIPKLFIHGDKDTSVPVQNAMVLRNAATGNFNTLKIIKGAGHEGDIFTTYCDETLQAIQDFTNSVFGPRSNPKVCPPTPVQK
jgi:pimeloyl-ACP methyl ester carboxylesterase